MVVLVEVMRKAYLASIVPVIVNAILNEHQVIVDIIAFVSKGDFPRSRLGEKQRGKILASWVTRKMRTIAQFGIRDPDGADSQITEVAEPRSRVGSVVGKGSSLRNVETIDARSMNGGSLQQQQQQQQQQSTRDYNTLPKGVSEMPADQYESSIVESPPSLNKTHDDPGSTPIEPSLMHHNFSFEDHSYNPFQSDDPSPPELPAHSYDEPYMSPIEMKDSSGARFGTKVPEPRHTEARPVLSGRDSLPSQKQLRLQQGSSTGTPRNTSRQSSYQLSYQSPQQQELSGRPGAGRLRVANVGANDDDGDWPQEALMHMKLSSSGDSGGRGGRGDSGNGNWDGYDGRGYGNAL